MGGVGGEDEVDCGRVRTVHGGLVLAEENVEDCEPAVVAVVRQLLPGGAVGGARPRRVMGVEVATQHNWHVSGKSARARSRDRGREEAEGEGRR